MAKCLVSLLVVLVVGACLGRGEDERIKMCGRDLIRLAVSSCGNSRLRRSTPEHGKPQADSVWDVLNLQHADPGPAAVASLDTQEMAPHRVRRTTERIPDVCCQIGCSIKDLIEFC